MSIEKKQGPVGAFMRRVLEGAHTYFPNVFWVLLCVAILEGVMSLFFPALLHEAGDHLIILWSVSIIYSLLHLLLSAYLLMRLNALLAKGKRVQWCDLRQRLYPLLVFFLLFLALISLIGGGVWALEHFVAYLGYQGLANVVMICSSMAIGYGMVRYVLIPGVIVIPELLLGGGAWKDAMHHALVLVEGRCWWICIQFLLFGLLYMLGMVVLGVVLDVLIHGAWASWFVPSVVLCYRVFVGAYIIHCLWAMVWRTLKGMPCSVVPS